MRLLTRTYHILIQEYDKTSVTTKGRHIRKVGSEDTLSFSGKKLAVALARTLVSTQGYRRHSYLDVISSIINLSMLLDSSSRPLRLKARRLSALRDFSRTNKLGELGQAIVWIYLMQNSRPYVIDFEYFCHKCGIAIPKGMKKPDFIGQDVFRSNNLWLAEAKGKEYSSSVSTKSLLLKALSQCDDGEKTISKVNFNSERKIAFCAELATDVGGISKLTFTDPISGYLESDSDDLILKIHYASWFLLVQDFDNMSRLLAGDNIVFEIGSYDRKEINGKVFWTRNIFREVNTHHKLIIGIEDGVIKFLDGSTDYLPTFELVGKESLNDFTDGTIII